MKTDIVKSVEIKEVENIDVAYIRHIGQYMGNAEIFSNLFGKLYTWAQKEGVVGPNTRWFACYYDDPKTTDPDKIKLDVCLSIPKDTKPTGEIKKMVIPAGKYAVGHFEIDQNEYEDAWNYLLGEWIPSNNLTPNGEVCFEEYMNDPDKHPEKKHIVDIYEPVKRI